MRGRRSITAGEPLLRSPAASPRSHNRFASTAVPADETPRCQQGSANAGTQPSVLTGTVYQEVATTAGVAGYSETPRTTSTSTCWRSRVTLTSTRSPGCFCSTNDNKSSVVLTRLPSIPMIRSAWLWSILVRSTMYGPRRDCSRTRRKPCNPARSAGPSGSCGGDQQPVVGLVDTGDAQIGTGDMALLDQLRHHPLDRVDRYRETDARVLTGAAGNRRVHAHQFASCC